jgi:hypothetical protein
MSVAGPPGDPTPAALRAVLDSVFASPDFRWAEEPPLVRLTRQWWTALLDWLRALQTGNPAAFRLVLFALLLVLALLLAHGAWIMWRTVVSAAGPATDTPHPPPPPPRDAEWYFRAADRAAADGRSAEALQLAFVGLALRLDGQGILHYQASKTPAECAREARLTGADRERLRGLVRTLYAHAFGGRPLSGEEYGRWRADLAGPWPTPPSHAPAH